MRYLHQALDAHRLNNFQEAERLYVLALQDEPQRADARYNLGTIYNQQGRAAEALREFSLAVEAKPDFDIAWLALSECAGVLGHNDLSLCASAQAIAHMPHATQAWLRHGLALNGVKRDSEAVAAYQRAVEIVPGNIGAWINLSVTLKNMGHYREAEAAILKAMDITGATPRTDEAAEADYNILHWQLALLKLSFGEYHAGFAYFRARFKGGTSWRRLDDPRPVWRGETLQGKTILVTAEQGHGDVLMMARYLPLLKQRGATVLFQTHPALQPYLAPWPGADKVISTNAPLDMAFDYHVPVFDLPYLFQTTLETIPNEYPYLPLSQVDSKTTLTAGPKLKVGVVWSGEPKNLRDKLRSIPLETFAALFEIENIAFYNFTYEAQPDCAAILQKHHVTNLVPQINSFADSAHFVNQLDLIITCDTAMAHLAGGMGKPVWVLLAAAPDWRWGYEREDTPWYPTARLFRQSQNADWVSVMNRVKNALKAL